MKRALLPLLLLVSAPAAAQTIVNNYYGGTPHRPAPRHGCIVGGYVAICTPGCRVSVWWVPVPCQQ